jgi:hypothetical protein
MLASFSIAIQATFRVKDERGRLVRLEEDPGPVI